MFTLSPEHAKEMIINLVSTQKTWAQGLAQQHQVNQVLAQQKIQQGIPLKEKLVIQQEEFKAILAEVAAIIGKFQPKFQEELNFLVGNGDEVYELLFGPEKKVASIDLVAWADENMVPHVLLGQVIDWTLRPYKMVWGLQVQNFLSGEAWEKSACPVCGEAADIAIIAKEDGKRSLGCSSCQVTWSYPRLKCPDCGSGNPENFKYYYLSDVQEQQIHYCENCHSYIKTIDQHYNGEKVEDLMQVSLLTAHLDILAQNKGLKPLHS